MKRRKIIRWKPIPDTDEMYWVSSNGKVQSRRFGRVRLLNPCGKKYRRVWIVFSDGKKKKTIHRLVGLLFVPNPYNYTVINHKNGITFNNYYKNLEWGTQQQNVLHSIHVLGHSYRSIRRTKPEKIKRIQRLLSNGKLSQTEISNKCNVSQGLVSKISRKLIS